MLLSLLLSFSAFAATPATFTDDSLKSELARSKWGVIYTWTPYMPLSIKGVATISEAVKKAGGALTLVVDGDAKPADVAAAEKSWPSMISESRPLQATQLINRGSMLHYPTAFFFSHGKLSETPLRGFKTAGAYERWLQAEQKRVQK